MLRDDTGAEEDERQTGKKIICDSSVCGCTGLQIRTKREYRLESPWILVNGSKVGFRAIRSALVVLFGYEVSSRREDRDSIGVSSK